ncbi:hypothetical protein Lesp02_40390 [Lentzea sp. NBRC 105346]|uniref:helix-turn-helix domain-containing protein n=1 Tax=Lentzea sp. NBRC 105346 TaxID=3032205 RepID=UPI0024A5DAFA|nr:helix-turn-helix transcriptional regulator [Lentzea sp. NBRC 105346]GLZ31851.1 hypothetical protein Lesp02_40390 [Lentzea sp. NBRC 105346]
MTASLNALLRTGPFHLALRAAIRQRGLTLDRLRCHLAAHGTTVAASTLSAWQQGKDRPISPRSLEVVAALEKILLLPANSLLDVLAGAGPTGWPEELPDLMPGFRANDLEIVARHERVFVNRYRYPHRVISQVVGRARRDGVDRFFAHYYSDGPTEMVTTLPSRNCRIGREVDDPEALLLMTELLFDHTLSAGDTWVFEFETRDENIGTCNEFAHGTRGSEELCLIEVQFHPEALPVDPHVYVIDDVEPRRVTGLTLSSGGAVHHLAKGVTARYIGIGWSWP